MKNFLGERKERIEKKKKSPLLRYFDLYRRKQATFNTILLWSEEMLPEPSPPPTPKAEPKAKPHPRDTCELVEAWP
jgi:hypothetical protein